MNFFHSLFKPKLDAMRAAAPRATLHLLHKSNGFSVYLGEAAAAQKVTQIGTLTDHAEDVLMDDPVLHLFVPLEHAIKFVDEVTSTHSVALVDVILADKVHAARYVMYAYFPRKPKASDIGGDLGNEWALHDSVQAEEKLRIRLAEHDGCSRWRVRDAIALRPVVSGHMKELDGTITHTTVPEFLAPEVDLPAKLAEKDADADFWG